MSNVPMVVHVVYSGLAGSPRVAIDVAVHTPAAEFQSAVVFWGQPALRPEYAAELEHAGIRWLYVQKRGRRDIGSYGRAVGALLALSPAVVVIHGLRNLPVAVWLRMRSRATRLCLVQHGPVQELQRWPWPWASRLACRLADAVVCVSPDVQAVVQCHAGRSRVVTLIPNGIPVAEYRDASALVLSGRNPVPRLVMAALLGPQKDHATLLRACAMLRDRGVACHLDVLGDGPLRPELQRLAAGLALAERVSFHGAVPRARLAEVLHASDVYVHATHSEGLSIAMLQAMATGLPGVATDVPGMSAFKAAGAAYSWVPARDPSALADAIAEVLAQPESARARGRHNRELALGRFDLAATVRAYCDLFQGWQHRV